MHWVLQSNLFKETEWDTLVGFLQRFGIPYSVHKVVPFIGELIPPAEPKHDKVICFGSYSMRHTAKAMGWNPGVYDLADVNFLVQKEHWGKEMLNHDAVVCEFKDAIIDSPTFIRPIEDTKYFAGKVFDPEEWNSWRKGICDAGYDYGNSLRPQTVVQLCTPKTIYAEYRFWIVNGAISTYSLYKRGSRVTYSSSVDRNIQDYAYHVGRGMTLAVNDPLPWLPKSFVLDVCKTPDGMRIVEINTINSAGFYAADIPKLVIDIEHSEGSYH